MLSLYFLSLLWMPNTHSFLHYSFRTALCCTCPPGQYNEQVEGNEPGTLEGLVDQIDPREKKDSKVDSEAMNAESRPVVTQARYVAQTVQFAAVSTEQCQNGSEYQTTLCH